MLLLLLFVLDSAFITVGDFSITYEEYKDFVLKKNVAFKNAPHTEIIDLEIVPNLLFMNEFAKSEQYKEQFEKSYQYQQIQFTNKKLYNSAIKRKIESEKYLEFVYHNSMRKVEISIIHLNDKEKISTINKIEEQAENWKKEEITWFEGDFGRNFLIYENLELEKVFFEPRKGEYIKIKTITFENPYKNYFHFKKIFFNINVKREIDRYASHLLDSLKTKYPLIRNSKKINREIGSIKDIKKIYLKDVANFYMKTETEILFEMNVEKKNILNQYYIENLLYWFAGKKLIYLTQEEEKKCRYKAAYELLSQYKNKSLYDHIEYLRGKYNINIDMSKIH